MQTFEFFVAYNHYNNIRTRQVFLRILAKIGPILDLVAHALYPLCLLVQMILVKTMFTWVIVVNKTISFHRLIFIKSTDLYNYVYIGSIIVILFCSPVVHTSLAFGTDTLLKCVIDIMPCFKSSCERERARFKRGLLLLHVL